jgi:molybdopterin-guanine dinucleotide biosynthesis protein MobB
MSSAPTPCHHRPPAVGFAAWSGAGKTTLLTKLIPLLQREGLRVSILKHAHHDFDLDIPGKDSYRLRKAGAVQTLIASDTRRALISELAKPVEPTISELIQLFDHEQSDLILVEGFRDQAFPKIEVFRPSLGRPPLFCSDPHIIAVVSDAPVDTTLPVIDLNDARAVATFILRWLGRTPA